MEEKNVIKISLSSFFLIIAIIAICIMGYFIYKLNNEKTTATEQISNLNNQINDMKNIVNTSDVSVSTGNNTNTQKNYELNGTYEWINPEGPTMRYTFSNGTFTYTETSSSKGNYTISGNKVKLIFEEQIDLDGSKFKIPDKEGIIEENKLIIGDITLIKKTPEIYSYSNMKGIYEWKNEDDIGIQLILSEDGTFAYYFEVGGITGNYTLVDNTIILNEIFKHGGGMGLVVTKGEKKLTINKDNSITGNFSSEDYPYVPSSITMKKNTSSIDDNFDIRRQIQSSLGADWNNDYLRFNY